MKLQQLKIDGIKGVHDVMTIAPINMIVAENGWGKTARIDALRFGITGHCTLGKRLEDVAKLCEPGGATVEIWTDMIHWTRTLSIDPKTRACSSDLVIQGQERISSRAAQSVLAELTGDFAPMFDLGAFTRLSPEKQREYIVRLCAQASPGSTPQKDFCHMLAFEFFRVHLGEGTASITHENLTRAGQGIDKTNQALAGKLSDEHRAAYSRIMDDVKDEIDEDLPATIAAVSDMLKAKMSEAKRSRDEGHQAARRLRDQKNQIQVAAATASDLDAQLKTLRAESQDLETRIAVIQSKARSRQVLENELEQANRQFEAVKARLAELRESRVPTEGEVEDALREAQEAEKLGSFDSDAWESARTRRFKSEEAALEASRSLALSREGYKSMEIKIAEATENPFGQLDAKIRAFRSLVDDLHPEAGAVLMEIEDIIDQYAPDMQALRDEADAIAVRIEEKRKDRLAKEQEFQDARNAFDELDRQRMLKGDYARKAAELRAKHDELARSRALHARRIEDDERELTMLQQAYTTKERALQELSIDDGADLDTLKSQLDATQQQIAKVSDSLSRKQRYETLEQEINKAIAGAERDMVQHSVCDQLRKALASVRETVIGSMVKPLVKSIERAMVLPQGGALRPYCDLVDDRGKPAFTMGWIRTDIDAKIPMEAMSGGELALYSAWLLMALLELAKPPLALLIIEGSELDSHSMTLLLDTLEANQNRFSNAFVLTCHEAPPKPYIHGQQKSEITV